MWIYLLKLNPIQDGRGGGQNTAPPLPPTSFSPVASTNRGISLQRLSDF